MSVHIYGGAMFSRILLSIALVTSLVIAPAHSSQAEECDKESCISVTADDESDEIVVSIQKPGNGTVTSKASRKPAVSGSFSAIADPKRTWIPYHPDLYAAWREAARKAALTRARNRSTRVTNTSTRIVTASLSDRVSQLIPIGALQTQPSVGVVVGRPVYFWSTTPTSFDMTLRVAGVPVRLELTPSFEWRYGDDTPEEVRTTSSPGAPYPIPANIFTYRNSGVKEVKLITTWSGEFTVAEVKSPINGVIRQSSSKSLDVRKAPHRAIG
jgi:hypothetical protein